MALGRSDDKKANSWETQKDELGGWGPGARNPNGWTQKGKQRCPNQPEPGPGGGRASVGTCASSSTSNSKALSPVPHQTFSKHVLCGWRCNRDVLMSKTEAVPDLWELRRSNWCGVTPPVTKCLKN